MSSDRAARSSENLPARGSSATRGRGAGTLSRVRRSRALAEAYRISPTAKRKQEEDSIALLRVGGAGRFCRERVHLPVPKLISAPRMAYHGPVRGVRSSRFPPKWAASPVADEHGGTEGVVALAADRRTARQLNREAATFSAVTHPKRG